MCVCVCVQQGSGKGEAWRSGLEEMLGSPAPASRPHHRPSHSADPKVSTVCVLSSTRNQAVKLKCFGTHSPERTMCFWPDSACKEQEV